MKTDYRIILASNSPRRRELLRGLGLDFEVVVLPDIDEHYPPLLPAEEVAQYVAERKADAYAGMLAQPADGCPLLVITADTTVVCEGEVMGKPADAADAVRMLTKLRGKTHQVVTGVCMMTAAKRRAFAVTTDVTFSQLADEEIAYYVENYRPYDKAGAYGIQEWIGYAGVSGIRGSYFNVMGLPVQRIFTELKTAF